MKEGAEVELTIEAAGVAGAQEPEKEEEDHGEEAV